MYRVKLILGSGRSLYPRDNNKVVKFARRKAVQEAESMISHEMGYSADLAAFGPKSILSKHPSGFDPVVSYEIEEYRLPLDGSSFFLGGSRVVDSN